MIVSEKSFVAFVCRPDNFVPALKKGLFRAYRDPYNTSAHCSIGEMQIVNRSRKEGPSKSVMLQAGQHKLSSLGQRPTMSPGSKRRAVI